ncbi:PREDICTED: nucleolar complex protein 2 homolog [Camelina sativa]|uniref:Nucleolar complex protein 2 homolog n=1 Tax=Camelina sativa TaxID=90675 RepID=A0ABM0TJI6_CAMSA|nr:PREDICTED: nucleolar complex protein 2 homolog [Camelina sativa]XP_010427326.1 PREDICTED: nucleolar complex protein 2 homolog [Camelina sativa]
MGKLGKKARKFAKKNLQSVEKRNRKLKPFFKKKFAKKNGRREAGDKEEVKKVEKQPKKICPVEDFQDIPIDAVFGKDDDEVLHDGDSDSDGYLDEDSAAVEGAEGDEMSVQSKESMSELKKQRRKLAKLNEKLVDEAGSDIMKRRVLSGSVLSTCCDLVDEKQSVQALIRLLNWYRAACYYGHEPSGTAKPDIVYDIEDGETFAKVLIFVLQKADHTFRSILGLSDSNIKEKILKLKNNPKWDSLKPLVKSFLRSTLHLVKHAADSEIIVFAVTQLRVSIVLFAAFPDLLKKLIKISIHLWVTGEHTLSKQAFLILKDISMVFNSECFDTCLVNMYKAYLHECDFPTANSERLLFLRDFLVELCSQDVQKSYTKASVSITQLAKLLKMALITKNKEAVEKIHSGQYTNCVDLWVNFIAANVQDCDLKTLLYTIVQVINGVAQLIIGPRYLLLRVKCIQWLNHLSRTSGIFIPIASLVWDMLEYKTTNDGEKQEQKKHDAVSTVKLPKNWLKSQNFQEQCIFSVIEVLAAHFAQWSFHISFPELATIPIMRLKYFYEKSNMEGLKRVVKRFIEQVESNIEFVQRKRDDATFSPNDQKSADLFMQHEKQNTNASYTQYYQSIINKAPGTKKKKK